VDAGDAGGELAFGGSFRTDQGQGRLQLAVLQLDEQGHLVASTAMPFVAGPAYGRVRGTLVIDGRARLLRLQIVPETPGRMRADNLYLIPQSGCDGARYPRC
jgi:hypothetical protein